MRSDPVIRGRGVSNSFPLRASKSTFCHDVHNYDEGVSVMAVLIENVFPVGITNEVLDAVTDEMGVDFELPPGGILHVHFEKDGRAHGIDVWDSSEAHEQFVQTYGRGVQAAEGLSVTTENVAILFTDIVGSTELSQRPVAEPPPTRSAAATSRSCARRSPNRVVPR
jgi:hypothetical protein